MLLPLDGVRVEGLHVFAARDEPELGARIRARGLELDAVMPEHGRVVLALDEEPRALGVIADDLGRLDDGQIQIEEDPRHQHDARREPARQSGVVRCDLAHDGRAIGERGIGDDRTDRRIGLHGHDRAAAAHRLADDRDPLPIDARLPLREVDRGDDVTRLVLAERVAKAFALTVPAQVEQED